MKLIHMKDSTVSINAFIVFISLGVIILFTVVGIVSCPFRLTIAVAKAQKFVEGA